MSSVTDNLEACPYCGCDQIHIEERKWVLPFANYCRNCRMYGPIKASEEQANEAWNTLARQLTL